MHLEWLHEELVSLLAVAVYELSIHPQECVGCVEGGALIAVHKRMVHRKALLERRRFLYRSETV